MVGFATPACADIGVSKLCDGVCTSVVLHDDVVPRVTPHAVRALLKDLLCTKVTRKETVAVSDCLVRFQREMCDGRAGVCHRCC